MQRRGLGQSPPNLASGRLPTASSSSSASSFRGRFTGSNKRRGGQGGWICHPFIIVTAVACGIVVLSWIFFPTQVREVEREAEGATHALAQKALDVEHEVEGWWNHRRGPPVPEEGDGDVDNAEKANDPTTTKRKSRPTKERSEVVPNAATARMEAQSSRWVDGEKALKKKLQVLYDMQQRGENLGVPVLTRYLGDDFPAWVEPGMDAEEWKKNVDAKYAEMREEEEEWKKEMQKLIEQRERDIGITTP